MNRVKILLAIVIIAVATLMAATLLVGSLLDKKITAALNERFNEYHFDIENINWSLIPAKLRLNNISITSKADTAVDNHLNGVIGKVHLKGIKLAKAAFKGKYEMRDLIISDIRLEGILPFEENNRAPTASTLDLYIGNIYFDQVNFDIKDSASSRTIELKEGALKIADFRLKKRDTLKVIQLSDFSAENLISVSKDSMYTFQARQILYSDTLKILSIESISLLPNYEDYDFTSKVEVETDCIEGEFQKVKFNQFSAASYYNSNEIKSSYVSIGKLELNVFRDKRKPDSLKEKPVFQHYIYSYPGFLNIDSIGINDGDITYTEHALNATEPGTVSFNGVNATIYNISNDTIYKTREAFIEMKTEALLMGISKMNVLMKARLFDPANTFSLKGTLAPIKVKDLNPILEKNAFLNANSATIDQLSFNLTGNDTKATGELIMLYKGLDINVKDKEDDDKSGIKEQFLSFLINKGAWDSNPMPSDEVRVGIIDFERDPTKFVFNYWIKSILTGVKSSVIKLPDKKKSFLQKIFGGNTEKKDNASKS